MSAAKSGELLLARKRSTFRVPMNGGSPKLFMEGVTWTDWMANGEVALVRPDAGQTRVEFPRGRVVFQTAGYVSHLRVSPTGDAVAFLEHPMAMDDGGNVVWVDSSGKPHRVSLGWASEEGLAWSADGREIWFTASRTGVNRALYAVTRAGSVRPVASIPGTMTLHDISSQGQVVVSRDTLRQVMWMGSINDPQEKDVSWFDWSQPDDISSDGRYLLFTEGGEGGGREYGVYIRDLTTGSTTKLSDGEGFAFLPDGKTVITMMPRENTHLNLVPVGAGQPRTIEGNGFGYQWAQPFPDGRKLLVVGSMPGKPLRLYTQSVDGGPLTQLSPEISLDFPKISPDGTRIAGATRTRKIAVIPAKGGAPEYLPVDTMHVPVKWSSDGSRLMIRTEDREGETLLEWIDLQSGKTTVWRKLKGPDGENASIGIASVSRDEKTYVYATHRRISELFVVDGWR
jgi:Tol biopolymer transport system component